MTDAFICDRCGAFGERPAMVKVASNSEKAGSVSAWVNKDTPGRPQPGLSTGIGHGVQGGRPSASASIKGGDLCEDCAEAFHEFWENGGDGE